MGQQCSQQVMHLPAWVNVSIVWGRIIRSHHHAIALGCGRTHNGIVQTRQNQEKAVDGKTTVTKWPSRLVTNSTQCTWSKKN
jgi:hypothetical protein